MIELSKLYEVAKMLWANAPRWRTTVIFTSVLTVLSLFVNPQVSKQSPIQNNPTVYQQPSTSLGLINPVTPVNQQAIARLETFYKKAVNEEKTVSAEGELCEKLISLLNLQGILPEDRSLATNAQQDMLNKTDNCSARISDSDLRWQTIRDKGATLNQPTIGATRNFLEAVEKLTDFDKSRSISVLQNWLDHAKNYRATLDDYLKELDHITALSLLYRPDDTEAIGTTADLVTARSKLEKLPLSPKPEELTSDQLKAIETTNNAFSTQQKSDRRLAAFREALARQNTDPVGVMLSLAALSPVDRARLDATQSTVNFDNLETQLLEKVPEALKMTLTSYQKIPTRQLAEQVKALRSMAEKWDVQLEKTELTSSNAVLADLDASHARVDEIVRLANEWQLLKNNGGATRDSQFESRLAQALKTILIPGQIEPQPFDANGMNDLERHSLGILIAASVEIQSKFPQGSPGAVRIYLDTSSLSDPIVADTAGLIEKKFSESGFRITETPSDAAVALKVFDPEFTDRGYDPETGEKRQELKLSASLTWNYSKRILNLPNIKALGRARDTSTAFGDARLQGAIALAKSTLIALQAPN